MILQQPRSREVRYLEFALRPFRVPRADMEMRGAPRVKLCVAALVMALLFGLKLPDHSGLPPGLRPHRPAVVAVVNALGAPLVGTGLVLPSAKALIASACRAAQLPPGTCSSL